MEKTFLSMATASMIVLVSLFAVCVTSCSSDDETLPEKKKATEAYSQSYVYVSESVLKFYDVKFTDSKGNTTTLTLENTQVADTYEGNCVKRNQVSLNSKVKEYNQKVRYYCTEKQTFTSFPTAELNYTAIATSNGQTPGENEKVWPLLIVDVNIGNNNPYGDALGGNTSSIIGIPATISNWSQYIAKYPQLNAKAVVQFKDAETIETYSVK